MYRRSRKSQRRNLHSTNEEKAVFVTWGLQMCNVVFTWRKTLK